MKFSKHLITLLIVLPVIFSCQKEFMIKPQPEPGYPTTYQPLTTSEWNTRNTEFQEINIHEGLSLNEFGIVNGTVQINNTDTITKEFLINKIGSLVLIYREFMGIPEDVDFNYDHQILIFAPYLTTGARLDIGNFYRDVEQFGVEIIKNIKHKYYLVQNRINGKYTNGIELAFNFNMESCFLEISGYWFQEAFIPQEAIYTKEEAFMIARKEVLERAGRDIWETKYNFHTNSILLKVESNNLIEVRDCWCVYAVEPPYSGYTIAVYIDTQTGEVMKYHDRL